ncbi:MAG: DUF4880 domain-containing protein [Candidatus Synoicihabitans palmerolidicus]|nr:DUF4880 domain-containing protein [Candidatus Synoicihabitans palmerolidicus]
MNSFDSESDAQIAEIASLWAARLEDGALGQTDRAELDAWRESDPRHREYLSEFCQLSADIESHLPSLVHAGAFTLPSPITSPTATARRLPHFGWITASALAIVLVAGFVTYPSSEVTSPQQIATNVAQRHAVTLDDGTQVDLNGHTNLVVESTVSERRVRLVGG